MRTITATKILYAILLIAIGGCVACALSMAHFQIDFSWRMP